MALSDVWRDLGNYISVYTDNNFDTVPESPGVYAWFYPIKLPSMEIEDLANEMSCVQNYDAKFRGLPSKKVDIDFNWKKTEVTLKTVPDSAMKPIAERGWSEVKKSNEALTEFRKILLVSSILMPPLYIGKTKNLRQRCIQHQNLSCEQNSFSKRFYDYAQENSLGSKSVKDLIFVCIKTDEINSNSDQVGKDYFEELIEEVLKISAKPVFGRL